MKFNFFISKLTFTNTSIMNFVSQKFRDSAPSCRKCSFPNLVFEKFPQQTRILPHRFLISSSRLPLPKKLHRPLIYRTGRPWDSIFQYLAIIEFGFRRIWRILQTKEGVIHRGRRPRWITPSEICKILHILRKPKSIIALLFIQNISSFLKEFRHCALCFSAHQI